MAVDKQGVLGFPHGWRVATADLRRLGAVPGAQYPGGHDATGYCRGKN
jgi:hypothetical protein